MGDFQTYVKPTYATSDWLGLFDSDGCWVGSRDSPLWTVNIRLIFRNRNIDKIISYFVSISNEFKNLILNINNI